ncbi:hypothetical protein, conserved [Eimeria tenella]|uniref:Uncharacterized protein n=1 Tax=Eimeria tenella TaxID=5802 RepID=U6KT23_EIMTE|nr:hypothetical protein, conserved [Eimeria tenella]CDJ41272.1 hypothetical protein, conserved [Eimeria tenella]|eukprot:XP_013232022.1 hypothetical protein, conserved [Eimeria tenella]
MADFIEAWYSDLMATVAAGLGHVAERASGTENKLQANPVQKLLETMRRDLQYGLRYQELVDYVCNLTENEVETLMSQVRDWKVGVDRNISCQSTKRSLSDVLARTCHYRAPHNILVFVLSNIQVLIKSSLVFEDPLEELHTLLRCLKSKFGRVPPALQTQLVRALLVRPEKGRELSAPYKQS